MQLPSWPGGPNGGPSGPRAACLAKKPFRPYCEHREL